MGFLLNRAPFVLALLGIAASASAQFTLQIGAPPSPPSPLVNHGDAWSIHKGTNAPQADWLSAVDAALDSTWSPAPGGFGYGDAGIQGEASTLSDMLNRYTTVFIRRSFDVAAEIDPERHLLLMVDYDDGFVAYLDGVEIRRANTTNGVGSVVSFNDTTGAISHEASCCNTPNPATTFDLGPVGSRLAVGTHILALVGLNQALGSSDFHIIADLSVGASQGSVVMGPLSTIIKSNSIVLAGSNSFSSAPRVIVNGDDAVVNSAQGTWSKAQPLVPGVNKIFAAATDNSGVILASTNHVIISQTSATSVGGVLGSNTTWTSAMGVIHVTNRVVITNGISLHVSPGCVLLFDNGTGIFGTNGALSLSGTADLPIYLLPGDVLSTNWGELAISGTNGAMLLQHVESISGHFEVFDGAAGTFEDCSLHDYWTASPAIVHTLGSPNTVTLNMRRCHVARYQEVLSQLATNHIEDSLFEYLGYSGDGIDFDYGQEGSYIRRCTLRRGQVFNTDAIDMGEFGANGTRVVIDSCLLHDFIDKGVSMGVQVYVTVTNTLIYNTDAGFGVKDNSEAGIYNCTVANVNYGFHEYNKADSGATTGGGHVTNSYNNIIWTVADTTVSLANGSTFVGTYSDFFQPWTGEGNISADPLFVNPQAHDYRVAAGSPTIGAGRNGANMGVTFPVGGIPAAPMRLAALTSASNGLALAWFDDSDNEDGFEIQRSTDTQSWEPIGAAAVNATNFTDLTAQLGAKYYYRARTTNSAGVSAFSNIAGGQDDASSAPSLDVEMDFAQVVISFAAAAGTAYRLEARSTFDAGSSWQTLQNIPAGPARSIAITNQPIAFSQFFRVTTP